MTSISLKISGMHCSHCQLKVEQALQQVAGVYGAAVNLDGGTAEVDFDGKAAPQALVAAVQAAGYHAEVSG